MRLGETKTVVARAALGAMAALFASVASAQNTSLATAASIGIGQPPAVFDLSPMTPERWYVFAPETYHSYCIDILPAPDYAGPVEITLELYRDGVFSFAIPNGGSADPQPGARAARYCDAVWGGLVQLRVLQRGASIGTTTAHQIRLVETTLFAPRFEIDVRRGVEPSILLSNTTGAIYGISVTIFDPAGHLLRSQIDFNIDPYASVNLALSGTGLASATGSIVLSHYGGPGALVAELKASTPHDGTTITPLRPREDYRD